jgi:hypothetical protein
MPRMTTQNQPNSADLSIHIRQIPALLANLR